MSEPRCFISYSWDYQEHKDWVRVIAENLQENGVKRFLDQWDLRPGSDLPKYMEDCIRESDFVLLVCTPAFAKKANLQQGGVGYEKAIVTGEIFSEMNRESKFIPILRKGNAGESLPSYLKNRLYIDFRDDKIFSESLEELLRHIYSKPKYKRPPLGRQPIMDFSSSSQKLMSGLPRTSSKDIESFVQVMGIVPGTSNYGDAIELLGDDGHHERSRKGKPLVNYPRLGLTLLLEGDTFDHDTRVFGIQIRSPFRGRVDGIYLGMHEETALSILSRKYVMTWHAEKGVLENGKWIAEFEPLSGKGQGILLVTFERDKLVQIRI